MNQYFPKQYEGSGGSAKAELNLPNYVIEEDLKGATGVDTSNLAAKSKAEIDKTDINKPKNCFS